MDSSVTDEKLWHLQHCPLFAGIGKAEMEELKHITVMFKLDPQEPGSPALRYGLVEGRNLLSSRLSGAFFMR